MTAMSTRDKWIVATLLPVFTLFIGALVFLRPVARQISGLDQRVQNQGFLAARQALVAAAREENSRLEKAIAEKRRTPGGEDGVFDRNWAMQQVSQLCDANGLSLDKSSPDPAAQLSPALKEALPAFAAGGTPPQVWRLEFSGAYPNVVKLLAGLQKAKPLIVPLNLSMQSGKTERQPASWVLTLWL